MFFIVILMKFTFFNFLFIESVIIIFNLLEQYIYNWMHYFVIGKFTIMFLAPIKG